MRTWIRLSWALLFCCSLSLSAQVTAFEHARKQFREGKTLSAAHSFKDLAQTTDDEWLRIRSLLAEGECYYALDLNPELRDVLSQAQDAIWGQAFRSLPDSARLVLDESYNKLWGSYYSMAATLDFTKALYFFQTALDDIFKLRSFTRYDSGEAERILIREVVGLYYNQKDYRKAREYSEVSLNWLLNSGFGPDGQPTEDFAEAVSSHALILARLGLFGEVEETLALVPDWNRFPAYLRRIGKIAMLRHDAFPEKDIGDAADVYRTYREHMISGLESRLPQMTAEEREQYWLGLQPFLLDAYRLGNAAPEMLYDMALLSKGFLITYATDKRKVTWKEVQHALKEGECAVEFVEYAGTGEAKKMGALVLRKDSAPRFVEVFDVDDFKYQMLELRSVQTRFTVEDAISGNDNAKKNSLYASTFLYEKVWTPSLREAIGNATKVYFSPDGIFHALAVEYMLPGEMTGKEMFRLSSTRTLLQRDKKKKSKGRAFFVGGVDYNAPIQPTRTGNDELTFTQATRKSTEMKYLTGSLQEVDAITAIRSNPEDVILRGEEATDEAICSLFQKGWDIVHISTHGSGGGTYQQSDLNPDRFDLSMSLSYLVLAGISTVAKNMSFDPDLYDGCLSAKEISREDLSGVDLTILSACQTSLGSISAEGVYGLQRGLKMAGANALILSLWSVNDLGTSELMTQFYHELQAGRSVHDAFNAARNRLFDYDYSYYIVNPFILIDVIE